MLAQIDFESKKMGEVVDTGQRVGMLDPIQRLSSRGLPVHSEATFSYLNLPNVCNACSGLILLLILFFGDGVGELCLELSSARTTW